MLRTLGFGPFRWIVTKAAMAAFVCLITTSSPVLRAQGRTDPALDAITAQFAAAVNAKDPARVSAFYTEDAVMMAPNEPMIKGRAQIEARYRAEFAAGIGGLILRPMESIAGGGVAFEAGTSTVALESARGTELASGKYVVIYKNVGGVWKIAYDIYTGD